jgi:hypothetical protein
MRSLAAFRACSSGGFGRGQDRTGWFLAKSELLRHVPIEISDRPWKLNG